MFQNECVEFNAASEDYDSVSDLDNVPFGKFINCISTADLQIFSEQ